MTNKQLAYQVLKSLLDSGVNEFCLCAGARNSPFVSLFEKNPELRVYHFFEERSAAFFALGRIIESGRPVAVVTTSGTAAAELLPAAIEGTYSSLPLVLVTADRPRRYRESGAPQSIEQVGIYSHYVEQGFDFDSTHNFDSAAIKEKIQMLSWQKPLHFNVCFEEPLIDDGEENLPRPSSFVTPKQLCPDIENLKNFLIESEPLVIVGGLPESQQMVVLDFLKRLEAPIYAEALSGLRGHHDLNHLEVRSGEKMLQKIFSSQTVNAVIRIGGVPTLRLWRDLEEKMHHIPVFSVGFNGYSGLSRGVQHLSDLSVLKIIEINKDKNKKWQFDLARDREAHQSLLTLLNQFPQSEPSLIYQLSRKIGGQNIYLGNSLPIREWDLCAQYEMPPSRVGANRGANGIDGQLSTFFGWCREDQENWGLVGDLTTMYDLSAPWIHSQTAPSKKRIVIINNGGGMIFDRMFKKEIFLNRHEIQFSSWAQMWNWPYASWTQIPEKFVLADNQIIELKVSAEQTKSFWNSWEKI